MDKYVVRKPTWKSITYSAILDKKKSKEAEPKPSTKKKPLQEKLEQVVANTKLKDSRRRLSIRDEKLLQLFSLRPDQPLVVLNEDSGLSNSSSNASQESFNDVAAGGGAAASIVVKNRPQYAATNENHLRELSDYVHCVPSTQEPHTLLISQAPSVTFNEVLHENFHNPDPANKAADPTGVSALRTMGSSEQLQHESSRSTSIMNLQNSQLARIQRDLNSPSATMRLRAIKALRSPTKTSYQNFDVPHEEQNIITEEERGPPPPVPTIQELMKNVVVYVEVRTGEDNRSAGVKKVISMLGARVNDKLLRDTTHVVFKDGLLSTYKKAKHWNIPVVSILWIEACKTEGRICDPTDYPISNIDRYENPELYEKMKRHKSMQPDSECNKRVRAKIGTPKESCTPQTAADTLRKACLLIGDNPTSTTKQTEISKFFARIGPNTNTPKGDGEAVAAPKTVTADVVESPATRLLNRINSNCYTPLLGATNSKEDTVTKNIVSKPIALLPDVRRTLNFGTSKNETKPESLSQNEKTTGSTSQNEKKPGSTSQNEKKTVSASQNEIKPGSPSPKPRKKILVRRRSVLSPGKEASETNTISTHRVKSSVIQKRRRSSIHTTSSECAKSRPAAGQEIPTIPEENKATVDAEKTSGTRKQVGRILKRRSTYTNRTVEVSPDNGVAQPTQKAAFRRRTLYTPQPMDVSSEAFMPSLTNSCPYDENVLTPTNLKQINSKTPVTGSKGFTTPQQQMGSLLEEHSNTLTFSSTRSASRRRTLFDVSMDIISQRLHNINNSARRSMAPTSELEQATVPAILNDEEELGRVKDNSDLSKVPVTKANSNLSKVLVTNDKAAEKDDGGNTSKTPIKAISTEASKALKKRKLYVPDEMTMPSPTPLTPRTSASQKRRRTITAERSLSSTSRRPRKSRSPGRKRSSAAAGKRASQESQKSNQLQKSSDAETPKAENTLTPQNDDTCGVEVATEKVVNITTSSDVILVPLSKVKGTLDITQLKNTNTDDTEKTISANSVNSDSLVLDIKSTSPISTPEVTATGQSTCAITDVPTEAVNNNCSELAVQDVETKKLPLLVCTNMHKEQVRVVREAIEKLGGFHLEHFVNDGTTHVVSYEPRRTLNLLRALIRGLWILEYEWVLESLRLGRWATEEPYELKSFSRAVEICRVERQAFGNNYKCELFTDLGPFYVSSRCGPISKENLRELIELCGGRIVEQRKRARYILGDSNRSLEDKIYITPFWILDSITQMQVLRFQRYAYPTESPKPLQQTQAPPLTQELPVTQQSSQPSQLTLRNHISCFSYLGEREASKAPQFMHY